jgi:hypothetical protein
MRQPTSVQAARHLAKAHAKSRGFFVVSKGGVHWSKRHLSPMVIGLIHCLFEQLLFFLSLERT